jgi:glycosyltransferase involved in cell wall biosynthesis
LKILLVTDGRYPEYVNGVSIYIRYLAEEMVKKGHDVYIFHHIKSGFLKRPRILKTIENHITYYGIYNSPISFSEGFVHPLKSCHESKTEKIFLDVLEYINPDIVHFHEFERTPSFCLDIVNAKNIPILVTLHDYWLICPRLQLFTLDESICKGPDEGKNCVVNCLAGDYFTRQYRKIIMTLPNGYMVKGIKKIRNMYKKVRGEHLGQTLSHNKLKKNSLDGRNKRLKEEFRARYIYNQNSLSMADLILAVSTCVKGIFEGHGIERDKIAVNQLGVKFNELKKRKISRFEKYPIRFGFLGHLGPSKGSHCIIEAAKKISPDRARFLFYGGADDETLYDFRRNTSDLKHCAYKGRYNYKELDDVFNSFEVLIIPSLWQETLGMIGLEAQAAGIPVIASDIGGMKDYVRDGINGLLFPPGDVGALTGCLNSILEHPSQIEKMSSHVMKPKTITDDYETIMSFYKDLLTDKKIKP